MINKLTPYLWHKAHYRRDICCRYIVSNVKDPILALHPSICYLNEWYIHLGSNFAWSYYTRALATGHRLTDAMKYADELLIKNGFKLLTEEEYQKYKTLM